MMFIVCFIILMLEKETLCCFYLQTVFFFKKKVARIFRLPIMRIRWHDKPLRWWGLKKNLVWTEVKKKEKNWK